ncbi:Vps5-domain-containing protein [Sporormia fimetaria CBS 119925]|uniref:Vps5-domain-containing protein n=1 Tax=Sporormia fimetaria CBS 119925 TaxID=1340428 RepID=A0A6A6UVN2_9PLEO|nr:Vps5-domain-containing protein [Sporormia fimetaria CBS 119925]
MDLDDEGSSPWGDVPSRSSPPSVPKIEESASQPSDKATGSTGSGAAAAPRSPAGRGPRKRQHGVQATRLEAVEDPLGPLGALSPPPTAEAPPAPPQKEPPASRGSRPTTATSTSSIRGMMDSVNLDDDDDDAPVASGPRVPPPVQPPSGNTPARQTQPSVSIEQASKPSFHISVGDPHKVGELTGSHTEYSVSTKTSSKGYRNPEFTVSRRYRDFLWLYNQLHNNNPGVIIPPPPEKNAMSRFDAEFVESRRAALERMLNKIAAHPVLQHDSDLKLFLESEAFSLDIKNKERKDPGLGGEGKGMFGGMLSGGGGKFIEHDDWFHDRRIYLDALENQLKALLKSMDTVVAQRKGLAEVAGEFSASLHSLAAVELAPSLSDPLDSLSDIQLRIRELYQRQAQQDVLTFGIVIDEYIRLIGSVKTAFQQRQKAYHTWHSAESDLQKKKATHDKLLRQGRSQQDRLNQVGAEVQDAEKRVHQARLLFEDMGRLMRGELERFEKEKVEDFKSGVETYLESAVEAQKEVWWFQAVLETLANIHLQLIEMWETFLMQLDAEDESFVPPAGVVASPTTGNDGGAENNENDGKSGTGVGERGEGHHDDEQEQALNRSDLG